MRRTLALMALLMVGGCVADSGPSAKASSSDTRSARADDEEKPKQMCEHTIEGNDTRDFCY